MLTPWKIEFGQNIRIGKIVFQKFDPWGARMPHNAQMGAPTKNGQKIVFRGQIWTCLWSKEMLPGSKYLQGAIKMANLLVIFSR